MDTIDTDLDFLARLANKYKKYTMTKKEIYTIVTAVILLCTATIFQTVNALTLQANNEKLKTILVKYITPPPGERVIETLPAPYLAQNVSLDFTRPMPQIKADCLNINSQACQQTELELPPTLTTKNNCSIKEYTLFAGKKYTF